MNELTRDAHSAAERFNAWYIPHCVRLADDWYSRHPRTVACAPLEERVGDWYIADRQRADAAYAARVADGSIWGA
jgi:hypothetical protein